VRNETVALRPHLGHRPALDGLRGVAILAVLACHVAMDWFEGAGHVGVGLFFVLSGFLITTLLVEEWQHRGTVSFPAFYARRALRLLPALLAMLAIVSVVSGLLLNSDELRTMLASAGLAALYLTGYATFAGFPLAMELGPTWTLAVEEQFYFLWPIVLLLMLRRGWGLRRCAAVALAAAVVAALVRVLTWTRWGAHIYELPTTWADGLLLGCALALAWKAGIVERVRRSWAWWAFAVLAALCLWSTMKASPAGYFVGIPAIAVSSVVLVASCLNKTPSSAVRLLGLRPLRWVGRRSYAIYLWNQVFILNVPDAWLPRPVWLLLGGLASFPVAELSWRLVERPALRAKKRFEAARATPRVPVGAADRPAA
jgi:peptidoglycan/LPS O-acetylase OafA/YrhL